MREVFRRLGLIQFDPLVLGVGLRDVAGPEDEAGEAARAERAGVGAVRDSRHLGRAAEHRRHRRAQVPRPLAGEVKVLEFQAVVAALIGL